MMLPIRLDSCAADVIGRCAFAQSAAKALAPFPTAQLSWQKLEYYAFTHFGMNTFMIASGVRAGPLPAGLTLRASCCAAMGTRVAKRGGHERHYYHRKTSTTWLLPVARTGDDRVFGEELDVKAAAKRRCAQGRSAAAREYGLKFGIYISPWDRNHPLYGTPY